MPCQGHLPSVGQGANVWEEWSHEVHAEGNMLLLLLFENNLLKQSVGEAKLLTWESAKKL